MRRETTSRLPAQGGLFGDALGAFADGAILFPLVAALSLRSDFRPAILLATAGAAYLAAAALFRVPMAVQPLKAVAVAALASGASALEVRVAGAALGVTCLALVACDTRSVGALDVNALAARVPRPLIHGVQLALGILLVGQGLAFLTGALPGLFAFLAAVALVAASAGTGFPLMGIVATAGLLVAVLSPWASGHSTALLGAQDARGLARGVRPDVVLALVLPQIALTLANSVLGTVDVAHRYFGKRAARVTPRRLLESIGIGNLAAAAVGGLPFCHGSGGVTAHVRGGASTLGANVVIGSVLLALAAYQEITGASLPLGYPPALLAVLLVATGLFHMALARPSWAIRHERARLLLMAVAALVTRNMLWVLVMGLVPELGRVPTRRTA